MIPVRNGADFLARSAASALEQDALEIIVVDNGSTDGTTTLMAELAARHPKITAVTCSRPGAATARNHGMDMARGDWVQFLDVDDELDPGKIAVQLSNADGEADWIIGAYRNSYPDGSETKNIPHEDPWKGLVFQYRIGCTHANLYRRNTLKTIGGWNEDLADGEDPELHFRLLKARIRFHIDPIIRCTYHHRPAGQLSKQDPARGSLRRLELLLAVNQFLKANQPTYWQDNSLFFQGALLRALRVLATHDLGAAAGAEEGMIKQWKDKPELISPLLWQCYRRLGFQRTEALRLRLRHLLPASFKNRLK